MSDYTVEEQDNLPALVKAVNELVACGYEPVGNITVIRCISTTRFYQALFKKDNVLDKD